MANKSRNAENNEKSDGKRAKVLNILEPGFEAPDGGWGWMIVAGSGFTNVFGFAIVVCFGLIFRDRFQQLGINASQTTTIINVNMAVACIVGLANGPLFRLFSYRQVACVGGFICALSICAISFMETFYGILMFFSILYPLGKSVAISANSLALYTYFNNKRRKAVGLSWACSGLGSIITPQITTILMLTYGMSGTLLVYGALALNVIVCALLLQPVGMHAKRQPKSVDIETAAKEEDENENSALMKENDSRREKLENLSEHRSSLQFGSQYLPSEDGQNGPVDLDIIRYGSSMMSRNNDGWFPKLNSFHASSASHKSMQEVCSRPGLINLGRKTSLTVLRKSDIDFNKEKCEANEWKRKSMTGINSAQQNGILKSSENIKDRKDDVNNTQYLLQKSTAEDHQKVQEQEHKKRSCCTRACHAISVFLDLDLLRDYIFVNLMIGTSFTIFSELNFILLTPYILSDYGFRKIDVAIVMSVLAIVDVSTRVTISFIASRIGWGNRTFLIIGIVCSVLGRVVFAHVSTYSLLLAVSVLSGIGKALTLVFSTLVIPAHVSLEKLAGATGLQLVTRGIIFLALGPVLGWIRDTFGNYTIMLHCLNVISLLVITSWILEDWCSYRKRQQLERLKVECA